MPSKFHHNEKSQSNSRLNQEDIVLFVLERFDELKKNPSMKELVNFHTVNKFLIMAHSPKELNILGNLVGNHNHVILENLLENYEMHLRLALKNKPSVSSNVNVLSHIFGHFSNDLGLDEKSAFLISLEYYRDGKITLSEMLCFLKSWTSKYDKIYLARQTYFLLNYESPIPEVFSKLVN